MNVVRSLGLSSALRPSLAALAYDKTREANASTSSVASSFPMQCGFDWKNSFVTRVNVIFCLIL